MQFEEFWSRAIAAGLGAGHGPETLRAPLLSLLGTIDSEYARAGR